MIAQYADRACAFGDPNFRLGLLVLMILPVGIVLWGIVLIKKLR